MRAQRPKATKLALDPELAQEVRGRLELDWPPQQIAAWLARSRPDAAQRVSHETIYLTPYTAARGELGEHVVAGDWEGDL